jgi:hypothetical protein
VIKSDENESQLLTRLTDLAWSGEMYGLHIWYKLQFKVVINDSGILTI